MHWSSSYEAATLVALAIVRIGEWITEILVQDLPDVIYFHERLHC